MLLTLAVISIIPSMAPRVQAEQEDLSADTIEKAVNKALKKLKNGPPTPTVYFEIRTGSEAGPWAFGSIVIEPPEEAKKNKKPEHHDPLPEAHLWLAQKTNNKWEAVVEYTPIFYDWVQQTPDDIIDPNLKQVFESDQRVASGEVSIAGDNNGNFSLPWSPGQTWAFNGGPHGWNGSAAEVWSSLDFGQGAYGDGHVLSAREGTVSLPCGNTAYVVVKHGDGWESHYFHLINIGSAVANNQQVARGQWIGDVGTAVCGGTALGPHVHFALKLNGSFVAMNGREIGGWTFYNGSQQYQGRAERIKANGTIQTVVAGYDGLYNIGVQYQANVSGLGWMSPQSNGATGGTTGQGRQLEAINISLQKPFNTPAEASICYNAKVQGVGWQGNRCDGQTAGTVGQNRYIEAIRIWLVNQPNRNGTCYRAYVRGIGWQSWVCDTALAGTEGQNRPIEALQIRVTP